MCSQSFRVSGFDFFNGILPDSIKYLIIVIPLLLPTVACILYKLNYVVCAVYLWTAMDFGHS